MMKRILMLILLLPSITYPADSWTVNTDGGGDYLTLAACVAAVDKDLTARGGVTITVDGATDDTTPVNLSVFTNPTVNYYLTIQCLNDSNGVWDVSKYIIRTTAPYGTTLNVPPKYTRIIGLQVSSAAYGNGTYINQFPILIRGCLFRQTGLASTKAIAIAAGSCQVENCGFFGGDIGIWIASGWTGNLVLNCSGLNQTTYGLYFGGGSGATATVVNTYFGITGTADYYSVGTGTLTLTDCYSQDGTLSTTVVAPTTANFTVITAGSENLHLPLGSALIAQGTDVASSMNTDVDIDGQTRPMGGTWDIGYDEYYVAPEEPPAPSGTLFRVLK
jgi:hypothetical protein